MAAMQILVSGVVQRVGYRAWTRRTAKELGLHGYVCNRDDGRVEIHAEGDAKALDALRTACWKGPAHAVVDDVMATAEDERGATDFVIAD